MWKMRYPYIFFEIFSPSILSRYHSCLNVLSFLPSLQKEPMHRSLTSLTLNNSHLGQASLADNCEKTNYSTIVVFPDDSVKPSLS